jgi:hypothetical protein
MKVIKSNKTTLTYDSVEIIIQDNQDNKKFVDIIYEETTLSLPKEIVYELSLVLSKYED